MKFFLLTFLSLSLILFSCKNDPSGSDLTVNVVGTYSGTVTINIGTDSAYDVTGQQVEIARVDDDHIQVTPLIYPNESPADTVNLTALLTPTPFGFITAKGVMLTLEPTSLNSATINGTPYSVSGGGSREAHGSYNRETGELVYAIKITKDGKESFELFQGSRE